MPASRDPRSYVRPHPLPIPACKGVKLLARDTLNFNPETPSREDVRKNNYNRRQNQMSLMGFRSLNHKPYIGIGDPFYLDEKKMILHALGQWDEEETSSSSSDDEDEVEDNKEDKQQPAFTAAKFVLRRSRKDLNTLNKAVVHGRHMIRNVRLGHGLFDLITKEKLDKKAASEAAFKKRQEQLRNEFQPPKVESEDETDEDIENDVDLTNYMVPVAPPTFMTQMQPPVDTDEELGIVSDHGSEDDQSPERDHEIVTFSGKKKIRFAKRMARAEEEEEFIRARSAMVTSQMTSVLSRPVSSRKKKQQTPRPYTPQHTNISTAMSVRETVMNTEEQDFDLSKDALFRQLCVLHWLLEAMSADTPSVMTSITSCWSLAEIGGAKAAQKKLMKDKATESSWASFISKESARTVKISPRVQIATHQNTNSIQHHQPPPMPFHLISTAKKIGKRHSTQRSSRSPHARRPLHLEKGRNSVMSSGGESQRGSATERDISPSPTLNLPGKLASLLKPKIPIRKTPSPTPKKFAGAMGQLLDIKIRGGLNTLSGQAGLLARTRIDEDHVTPQAEEEDDQAYNKSIFKFLDEYYESLKYEEELKGKNEDDNKSTSSSPPLSPKVENKDKKQKEKDEKKNKRTKKKKDKEKEGEKEEKRLDHKVAVALGEEEKMSSKFLRANAHFIRPKSSAALLDFQATLPSNKKSLLCTDLQNKFAECREERALTLHDILDHKESQRMLVCQNKFESLSMVTRGSSFHRATDRMRSESYNRMRKPQTERKKSQAKGNWYSELVAKIPQDLKQEWYYNKIINKLGNFGLTAVPMSVSNLEMVEGTGKQSIYKFLKVLQGLREWEICSPDVTAAVEFCREHIVEMTIEEYEWWFKQQFPKVTRPQTAPPATKSEKKESENVDKRGKRMSVASVRTAPPRRAVQSAFVRRAQR